MKKVYIDCGAWMGSSVLAFKKYYINASKYDIYAFECEPRLKESLKIMSNYYKFTFIDKAVFTHLEEIKLYPGIENMTQSSSILPSKKKYIDKEHPITVMAIDFSQWILDTFDTNNYIICKMNIEGAEYDVLEKMIRDKTIQYINKLYVAWHNKKVNVSYVRHRALERKIKNLTELHKWSYEGDKGENPF